MSCFAFTRAITRDTSNRVGEYIIHKAAMFAHIPESKLWKVIWSYSYEALHDINNHLNAWGKPKYQRPI